MANTILQTSRQADATAPGATALKVGELAVNTYDGKLYLGTDIDGTAGRSAGGAATAATWVGGGILDQDGLTSDSATNLATQQSIKAYVDDNAGVGDITGVTLAGDSGSASDTSANVDLTIAGGSGITTSATGTTVTIAGDNASTSAKGVASFSSDNFSVSSGAVTIKDGGVVTAELAADAVTGAKIADDAIDSEHYTDGSIDTAHIADNQVTLAKMAGLARGKLIYGDASGDPAALAAGANGKILVADANGDLSWTTLSGDASLSAGALTIASGSVENAMLAGSIANAKLSNSAITCGGTATSLGGTITGAHIAAALNSDLGGNFTIGNQSDDVCTITGDLTVSGTTTTTQHLAVGAADTIIFEGATANSNETTLTVVDPTGDNTITLPDITGTVVTTGDTGTVTATMLAANSVDSSELVDGGIDTSHLSADCVTAAKIGDDVINSEHLVDGSIDTAHIADNQVTLAKMAGLARGKIIYGDASGDPAALAAGANGKILVADANGDLSWTTLSGDATLSAGALTIASGSVENAMLAGSIANAKLSNSAITIAGASTSLGGSISAATIAAAIDSETMTLTNTTIDGGAYTT